MSRTLKHPARAPGLAIAPGQVSPAFDFFGTSGDDRIKGWAVADRIDVSQGGDDVVRALGGDDSVYFGGAFTGADRVDGGKGVDTVTLDGDYSAGVEVQAESFDRIERLVLQGGSYVMTGELAFRDQFGTTIVNASSLSAFQSLQLDVSSLGDLNVNGGHGDDVLHASKNGGASFLFGAEGDDTLIGGSGDNLLAGGFGSDHIVLVGEGDVASYGDVSESRGKSCDTIDGMLDSGGRIRLLFDSDADQNGIQHDFSFEKTADRTGNILIKYDAASDETIVKVFTDPDHKADMILHLTGDVPLTPADFIFG